MTSSILSRSTLTLGGVAVLMVIVYGAAYLVGAGLKPPRIDLPPYDPKDLPLEIELPSGRWQGGLTQIDERLTRALKSQAVKVENRAYRGPRGQVVTVHMAIFGDHQLGLTHTPFECYRGNGWNKLDSQYVQVHGAQGRTAEVSLSMWRRTDKRVYVLYWYQFGDEVLLDRDDLGRFRWKMAGKESWPALVKVMLETPAESQADRQGIVELAEYIYRWTTAGGVCEKAADEQTGQPQPKATASEAASEQPDQNIQATEASTRESASAGVQ